MNAPGPRGDSALAPPAARRAWLERLSPRSGRWVTPEELNVAPGLLGLPLARPTQRLLAMGVDLAVIGLVSTFSNLWLLAACALGIFEHRQAQTHPPGLLRRAITVTLFGALLLAGVYEAVQAPPAPSEDDEETLVEEGDGDAAGASEELIAQRRAVADALDAAARSASSPVLQIAAAAASSAVPASAPSAAASDPVAQLQARVRHLERRLAREQEAAERAAQAQNWRERLRRLGLDFGIGYGWSLVYFTMLPAWWRGQTLGKRLFGLRVLEITGKPMTPLLNFKRFGGYLAGMATGGLGLVQLLWDPNRQGLQDKAAHTVVVNERAPRMPAASPSAPAPNTALTTPPATALADAAAGVSTSSPGSLMPPT
ncbi:RDD family protein [Ideonella sp. DXS29W]|uniref:RDD family protein n=1 Tax=Ideonella lacteola TaxID=2984193 RepID=A0ABU9BPX8_9BURK